jgi:hypothetical protein
VKHRAFIISRFSRTVPLFVIDLGSYFLRIRSVSVLVIPHRDSFARPQHRFFECFFAVGKEDGAVSRSGGEHVERLGMHLSK